MEIVSVFVEYPSGLLLSDRATYQQETGQVCVSERLAAILREFLPTEARPAVSVVIDGRTRSLQQVSDREFAVLDGALETSVADSFWSRLVSIFRSPTRDQRQQLGRFCHSVSVAALAGAVGLWHSTTNWTFSNVFNEAVLTVVFLLAFYEGMVSMNGE
jgi:hypothetical protein